MSVVAEPVLAELVAASLAAGVVRAEARAEYLGRARDAEAAGDGARARVWRETAESSLWGGWSLVPYAGNLRLLEAVRDLALSERLHYEDVFRGQTSVVEFDVNERAFVSDAADAFVSDGSDDFFGSADWDDMQQMDYAAFDEAMRIARSGGGTEVAYVTRREREVRAGWEGSVVPVPTGRDRLDVEPSMLVDQFFAPWDAERSDEVERDELAGEWMRACGELHRRLSIACATAALIGDPSDWSDWSGPLAAAQELDAERDVHTDRWLASLRQSRRRMSARPVRQREGERQDADLLPFRTQSREYARRSAAVALSAA